MLCASPDFAWHAIAKALLDGKPLWATTVMVARYTRLLTARRSAAVQIADRRTQF